MDSQITEFSFGFALTQQLLDLSPEPAATAPFFPSLIAEAQLGYDVQLDFGFPLFLQFKLSQYMVGNAAGQSQVLPVPYFRFWLMPTWMSQQHNLLVDLENSGQTVYYVAPWFWTQAEFNQFYSSNDVPSQSAWVRPAEIGEINDPDNHCIIFNNSGGYFLSEPEAVDVLRGQSALRNLRRTRRNRKPISSDAIASSLEQVLAKREVPLPDRRQILRLPATLTGDTPFDDRTAHAVGNLEYISFLSHAYFHAEFVFYPLSRTRASGA